MGNRYDLYDLEDMIEFDEAYFTVVTKESDQQKLKIGRGSQKQSNAAVMAESVPLEDPNTGKQSKHCRYFKMKGLNTHKKEEINTSIKACDQKLDNLCYTIQPKHLNFYGFFIDGRP